jgi:hypothetical protein
MRPQPENLPAPARRAGAARRSERSGGVAVPAPEPVPGAPTAEVAGTVFDKPVVARDDAPNRLPLPLALATTCVAGVDARGPGDFPNWCGAVVSTACRLIEVQKFVAPSGRGAKFRQRPHRTGAT